MRRAALANHKKQAAAAAAAAEVAAIDCTLKVFVNFCSVLWEFLLWSFLLVTILVFSHELFPILSFKTCIYIFLVNIKVFLAQKESF